MFDLKKLEEQLAQYTMQRTQHQEMFHKLSGAIEAIQIVINAINEAAKEIKDVEIDHEGTQKASQE